MFVFWGDGSEESKALVDAIRVRSTENFNWTFIFILAVVFYVYWSEIHKKNKEIVFAGLALYGVHWLYEIANAVIAKIFGYPLWAVSNESTTFILLIGVCWELSMMFSLAGIISFKMLPQDRTKRYFAKNGRRGISCKLVGALEMALLFAGRHPRVHHDLCSVLPGKQLRAGYGAREAERVSDHRMGARRRAARRADPARDHLILKIIPTV